MLRGLPHRAIRSVVVVDRGSTDRTAEIARDAGALLLREASGGYGAACLRAPSALLVAAARARRDRLRAGRSPGRRGRVPALVAPIAERSVELVLGVEPGQAATSGSKLVTGLIDTVYRHRWSGVGPVRAMRFPALIALGMSDRSDGWDVEMLVRGVKLGLSCDEVVVPADAERRAQGARPRAPAHPSPRNHAMMHGVIDALERFAREFPAGAVLFEEGQPGHVMYIVVTGEVEIRRQVGETVRVLAVLPPGEFFGEMAILNGRPRSADRGRPHGRAAARDRGKTFEAMLRARPEIALRMIKSLATRLDSANQHVELLLLPTANHRVVQCLRQMAEEQLRDARPRGDRLGPQRRTRSNRASWPGSHSPGGPGGPGRKGRPVHDDPWRRDPRAQGSRTSRCASGSVHEVNDVIDRLRAAQLVLLAEDAGIEGGGFIVPEVGRLLEFLEFLTLKDQFGG